MDRIHELVLCTAIALGTAACSDVNVNPPLECVADSDCAGKVELGDCQVAICQSGDCVAAEAPAGTACESDGADCTEDVCAAGTCTHNVVSGCFISGACFADGEVDTTNECRACDGGTPQLWTHAPDDTPCEVGVCKAGVCVPPECTCSSEGTCCDGCQAIAPAGTSCEVGGKSGTCDAVGGCVADGDECSEGSECCEAVAGVWKWKPAGAVCGDDGIECTDDVCDADHACVHQAQTGWCAIQGSDGGLVCYAQDTPNPTNSCQYCDALSNSTGWRDRSDTFPCSDGNACTTGDQCMSGTCEPGTAVPCEPPGQCYDEGTCDPASGECQDQPKAAGATCDDGNAATSPDACDGDGGCKGEGCDCAPGVDDPACCGSDEGDPATYCKAINAGAACPDDGVTCTSDTCSDGTCQHPVNAQSCYIGGVCYGQGIDDPGNDCRFCDPGGDSLAWSPKPGGTSCDDGDACTQTDKCQPGGQCIGSNPVACAATDQCHNVGTCDPATGECSSPVKTNGAGCDDEDACTSTDVCTDGVCGGLPVACGDPPQCHTVTACDGGVPCVLEPVTCTDSITCCDYQGTGEGHCVDGECIPPDVACAPPGSACCDDNYQPTGEGQACADGDGLACTSGKCAGGFCEPEIAPNQCLIGGACYASGASSGSNTCLVCNPSGSATSWSYALPSKPCNDGNACTVSDHCDGFGSCQAGPIKSWPAGDAYEAAGNDSIWDLAPLGVFEAAQVVGPVDTNFHYFDPDNPGGPAEDKDFYYWSYVHYPWGDTTWCWTCQVSGLEPDQEVLMWLGAGYGNYTEGQCFNAWGDQCTGVATGPFKSGDVFALPITLKTGWGYTFAVGISPLSGVDQCGNSYGLKCKLTESCTWP